MVWRWRKDQILNQDFLLVFCVPLSGWLSSVRLTAKMFTKYSVSAVRPVRVKWFLDGGSLSSLALPPLVIW